MADASPNGADVVHLLGDMAFRCSGVPHHIIGAEIVGERDIRLNPEEDSRWEEVVVSAVNAAVEASKRNPRPRCSGLQQDGACASPILAHMPANVETGPVQGYS